MVRSLFLLPFMSNPGYAISGLERLFFETGLELAGGDPGCVHFGYHNFLGGHPKFLPQSFSNLVQFNLQRYNLSDSDRLAAYVKAKTISLVVIFDAQPVHPLFRILRHAGVSRIVSYSGAPISSLMPPWKLVIKKAELALSSSKVDGMIFESRAMADFAVYGRGVPERMIDIVPLGVNTDVFHPATSDYVYTTLGLPRDRKIVIYSGHMERRKGVATLVEAAIDLLVRRRRTDVGFLLCGNRNAGECRDYREMYDGMGIDEFIRFGGYRSDMAQLFQSCFCGVIPSSGWDSFTLSSLEMAASGLPVIASRLGGLREAVADQETGLLFEPGSAGQLGSCIEKLLDHGDLSTQYGHQGRARCESYFNLKAQHQRFRDVLSKYVLKGSS